MLTIFRGSTGPTFVHYLEDQRSISRQYYSDMLKKKIGTAIRTIHRGLLITDMILLGDNARQRTVNLSWESYYTLHRVVQTSPHRTSSRLELVQKVFVRKIRFERGSKKCLEKVIQTTQRILCPQYTEAKTMGKVY